ncbi:hypothetical protein HPB47_020422 [Ixodes persulcatus]|uniref:Uncharacterized protein n=1 Tax=Ixodes persulcatus TaxID=34615 RepID=A0AC60QFG5_IXOPE|nr:hypothetical protein HPB47_020422 [Ixodes persulcatus]
MNHVWPLTLKTAEGKRQMLDCHEFKVRGLRCTILDPDDNKVYLRLHWVPYHIPDEAVRRALKSFCKVSDNARETWLAEGFEGIESKTGVIRMKKKEGMSVEAMPHQLRFIGGSGLLVISGRTPLCLRCCRTGHKRRECRMPKCAKCRCFGHQANDCVMTYFSAIEPVALGSANIFDLNADKAERATDGTIPMPNTEGEVVGPPQDAVEHSAHRAERRRMPRSVSDEDMISPLEAEDESPEMEESLDQSDPARDAEDPPTVEVVGPPQDTGGAESPPRGMVQNAPRSENGEGIELLESAIDVRAAQIAFANSPRETFVERLPAAHIASPPAQRPVMTKSTTKGKVDTTTLTRATSKTELIDKNPDLAAECVQHRAQLKAAEPQSIF